MVAGAGVYGGGEGGDGQGQGGGGLGLLGAGLVAPSRQLRVYRRALLKHSQTPYIVYTGVALKALT